MSEKMPDDEMEGGRDSPECLLRSEPVKDPYSTDEDSERRTKLRNVPRKDYKLMTSLLDLKEQCVLHKKQNSCMLKPECVHFFFCTDYEPMNDEIHLEDSSIEDCLYHALKFTSNGTENRSTFLVNGVTIKDIIERYANEIVGLSWIFDNDTFNFKQLSPNAPEKKRQLDNFLWRYCNVNTVKSKECVEKMKSRTIHNYANFVKNVFSLFEEVYDYVDNDCVNGDSLKVCHEQPKEKNASSECSLDLGNTKEQQKLNFMKVEKMPKQVKDSLECIHKSDTRNTDGDPDEKKVGEEEVNLSQRSELVKKYLENLASFFSCYFWLRNGDCKVEFPLMIQEEDISCESQLIEDREVDVVVKPDGVFVRGSKHKLFQLDTVWKLVIEIYVPYDEEVLEYQSPVGSPLSIPGRSVSPDQRGRARSISPQNKSNSHSRGRSGGRSPSVSPLYRENNLERDENISIGPPQAKRKKGVIPPVSNTGQKPVKTKDSITMPEYCTKVRDYIRKSLPVQCRSPSHMFEKMAGQHVAQLFCQARQNMVHLENVVDGNVQKAIGWFIVNEYVYFSKLLVEKDLLPFLNHGYVNDTRYKEMIRQGKVRAKLSYSNFRFDLTIASHRIALIIFLHHILESD